MRAFVLILAAATFLGGPSAFAQDINDVIDFAQNMSAQSERFRDTDDRHVQEVRTRDADEDASKETDAEQAAPASDRDTSSHDVLEGRKWGDSDTQGGASPSH